MKKFFQRFLLFILLIALGFAIGYYYPFSKKGDFTTKDMAKAAQIIDLQFDMNELDSALNSLKDQQEKYQGLRDLKIPNGVWPALLFNPIPTGKQFSKQQNENSFASYTGTLLPEDKNELAFYSIGQLAELLRTQQITSKDLTEFFIDRLKKYDPQLHCVITLTEDLAMKQAKRADAEIQAGMYKGLLHGIPYGIKDLLNTKTYNTTYGATAYKDQLIDEDASVVKMLEKKGAVLIAKLTLGALAMDDVWFGEKTRNPWNTKIGSSGSSAGPASAVSAGLVPFAIGSETWGSIVSPANRCGVTGLRPTYGRISRTGAMALSWSMDKLGPITRYVEDCAIVFEAIYGPDNVDPTIYDLPFNYQSEIDFSKLKIGYIQSSFENDSAMKPFNYAGLKVLEDLGAELIPFELPKMNVYDLSFLLSAEAAAAFDELTLSNRDDLLKMQTQNSWPNIFRSARFIPAVEYIQANRARQLLIQQMEEKMQGFDLFITPSFGKQLLLTNLTGHPCVVLPNGFIEENKPISISFIGQLFDEATILAVAKAYQDVTEHHLKHPILD